MKPELRYNQITTKKAFESRLVDQFGSENISKSKYEERAYDDDYVVTVNKMTLYYHTDRGHIGTWMKGIGWIFESAYRLQSAEATT